MRRRFSIATASRSGRACGSDDARDEAVLERLSESLRVVLRHATNSGVTLGFEPEPGMFIDTLKLVPSPLATDRRAASGADARRRPSAVPGRDCRSPTTFAAGAQRIVNVHIEDMRAGVHEHLMFGEGEMRFPTDHRRPRRSRLSWRLHVELSRHSHEAPTAAQKAFDFFAPGREAQRGPKTEDHR